MVPDEAPEPESRPSTSGPSPRARRPRRRIVWGPADPSYTNDPEGAGPIATFAFESNEAQVTYECALDSAPFTECPDPSEYTGLTPGRHILRVRAVDLALNVDPSPASWSWTVVLDSTAPTTTINTAETTVLEGEFTTIFGFTANEPIAEFECSIDAEPFEQCESPMEYSGLTAGRHTFRVRAIDLAGNIEQPPVTRTFDLGMDANPPETTINSGPGGHLQRRLGELRVLLERGRTRRSSARSTASRSRSASTRPSTSSSSPASTPSRSARSTRA